MTAAHALAPFPAPPTHRPTPTSARVDPYVQQRRALSYTAAVAAMRLRAAFAPSGSTRRRQSLQLCSAARILTALGVRVEVVQPSTPWPRHRPHRLVAESPGRLGELALLTAVPRTTHGWTAIGDRVLPFRATRSGSPAPTATEGVACPVRVRFRTAAGALASAPADLAEIVALDGLVVEVHLLPAVEPEPARQQLPRAA